MNQYSKLFWNIFNSFLQFSIFSILFIFLFLSVDFTWNFILGGLLILLFIFIFGTSIYKLVQHNRNFNFLFFKGTAGSIFLIVMSAALSCLIIVLFSINMIVMTKFGKSMTFQDKVTLFSIPVDQSPSPNYKKIKSKKEREKVMNMTVYHEKEEVKLLPIIKQSLLEAKQFNDRIFEKNHDRNIDLILHNSTEDLRVYTSLVDTLGYYDDTNSVIGIAINNYEGILTQSDANYIYFHSTIMHEYTHYRLQSFIKTHGLYVYRIPLWFHEGVSEYIGMNGLTYPYYTFKQIPLEKLTSYEQWETYRTDSYDVYAQSYFAINYLVEQYGEKIISNIIIYTAETNNFNDGFKKATGLSIHELDSIYMKQGSL